MGGTQGEHIPDPPSAPVRGAQCRGKGVQGRSRGVTGDGCHPLPPQLELLEPPREPAGARPPPRRAYRCRVLPGRWVRLRYDRLALLALLDR